jgi:hypothetical protein
MLLGGVSRVVDAVEPSEASVAYLATQINGELDPSWRAFYTICRELLPSLPVRPETALSTVELTHDSAGVISPNTYDLSSMHFVAESVTEDFAEFTDLCELFVRTARPGGWLLAAFMENMRRYRLGDGSTWPGTPVDSEIVRSVFAPHTTELEVTRIDADESLPDYGYTGMVLLTARRPASAEA